MWGMLKTIFGWHALVVIALLIALAQFLSQHKLVHRILWVLAAIAALAGLFNEWNRDRS